MAFFGFGAFSTPVGQLIGKLCYTVAERERETVFFYAGNKIYGIVDLYDSQRNRQTTRLRRVTYLSTFKSAISSTKLTMGEFNLSIYRERKRERW